uniref:Uncharacterized protein n=1 Tax=Leersia perrieri TaxID=77586 RepID=A0A0D9Y1S1_9ORYZ
MERYCVVPLGHNISALVVFTVVRASTSLSSALVVISRQVLCRLLRAPPPRLPQAATVGRSRPVVQLHWLPMLPSPRWSYYFTFVFDRHTSSSTSALP